MSEEKKQQTILTKVDLKVLLNHYDKDHDGKLSDEEIKVILKELKQKTIHDSEILRILEKYDSNHDGTIDENEIADLQKDLRLSDTQARYAGYTAGFARAFRYLAFTSDFGEALRPVVSARIVTGSYAVAIGYCFADVGFEAYKLHKRGYVNEKQVPMSMTQLVVERSTFQAVASITVPFLVIHTTVDVVKKICEKAGRFKKWGPSVAGLCIIPFLPLYLDEPVEHGLEWVFERYGPWAHKSHTE